MLGIILSREIRHGSALLGLIKGIQDGEQNDKNFVLMCLKRKLEGGDSDKMRFPSLDSLSRPRGVAKGKLYTLIPQAAFSVCLSYLDSGHIASFSLRAR
ncbi:hypothetical protein RRG08_036788 [Elysia crispata]|uniref:Uncharacterized protein n=1 Tax=Elysia crispata TaxID=231223 RepID=A0AAE1DWG0_9GAST|nr:hypothetical protein RRG08_036788 [Elysia crispata]